MTRPATAPRACAAVDMGSSSIKLLVQQRDASGRMHVVADRRVGANLGKGIGPDRVIPVENMERAMAALRALLQSAAQHGVDPADIPVIATAAVRNAPNGGAFMARVKEELGLRRARVLSGTEEAETGYRAALLGLGDVPPGRYATLDLGGGSFQLAVGTHDRMEQGASTQVGSNHVQGEMLPADIITPADLERADRMLATRAPMPMPADVLGGRRVVGMGGIALFLAAQFGRDEIPRDVIQQLRAEVSPVEPMARAQHLLRGMPADRMAALGLDTVEGQLDYARKLPAKLTLLLHIMRAMDLDTLAVSRADARHLLIHDACA